GDLRALMREAGAFIVEAQAFDRSVYRLFHEALADYVRAQWWGMGDPEVHRRITEVLVALTPDLSESEDKNWAAAHPYTRAYLSSHAAKAGGLDPLIADPLFLTRHILIFC